LDPFFLSNGAVSLGRGAASLASTAAGSLGRGATGLSSGPVGLGNDTDISGIIGGFETDPSVGDAFVASQASATSGGQRRKHVASFISFLISRY
jgi:hypothetical protein